MKNEEKLTMAILSLVLAVSVLSTATFVGLIYQQK